MYADEKDVVFVVNIYHRNVSKVLDQAFPAVQRDRIGDGIKCMVLAVDVDVMRLITLH